MFPIRHIHQVEITSRCNLRCKYCVHPHMVRPKQDMSETHYLRTLTWAKIFIDNGGPRELNLAGIGESTMHPDFVRWVFLAREALGEDVKLVLATNGLLMTDEMAMAIAPARPQVFVSLHRPERAGPAVAALNRAGILAGVSADPSVSATDWAGQVKFSGLMATVGTPCPWIRGGWVIVLSDGRLTKCSFDGTGVGFLGTIEDDLAEIQTAPYSLCTGCHQDVGVHGFVQPRIKELDHAS